MFVSTAHTQVVGMTLLRILHPETSIPTFSFGVARMIASTTYRRSLRPSRGWTAPSPLVRKLDPYLIKNGGLCTWATASEASAKIDKFRTSVENFEDELYSVPSEIGGQADDSEERLLEVAEPQTAVKISLLESNIQILEQECGIAQLMLDEARARNGWLYLGLDISMSSTGYAVLTPSILAPDLSDDTPRGEALIEAGESRLVEWGCISGGTDNRGDKNDVVAVGIAVEEALKDVATRCRRVISSEGAGGLLEEAGDEAAVWVVGVEDFMRRFLPGKSNAKSMFALAQLNGIVKYACRKHLGAKAGSFHPSTPRSFYGLMHNKPEGKDMKEIVHEFALSQEGGLDSRYDWPLSVDGSKATSSYDVTDAYLVALYSWHRDVYRALADNEVVKGRFIERFQARHAEKLVAAEQRALKILMDGDMPSPMSKKKLKPMTERSARNAHRKLENIRLTKAFETALLHWFKRRVLPRVTSS